MAKKSLGRREDIAESKKAVEREERHFLKIPDSKTPWYLLGIDYTEGFMHWYEHNGVRRPVVCGGGLKGRGFATDECPLCAHVAQLYSDFKELEADGQDNKAAKVKKAANDLRAKADFRIKAVRGNRLLMKTKTGKKFVADWDTDDEDSNVEAGILSMSESQFLGLVGMVDDDDNFPQIADGEDLANRVLWTSKERRKGKKSTYSQVVWSADKEASDFPDFDVPEEINDIDLDDDFKIDLEELEKVSKLVTGSASDDVDEDEAVEYEDDVDDEDSETEPDNEYLDDVEVDEIEEEDLEAEDEDAGQFEDDIPGDDLPKKSKSKVKSKAPAKRPSKPAKSGKRRM